MARWTAECGCDFELAGLPDGSHSVSATIAACAAHGTSGDPQLDHDRVHMHGVLLLCCARAAAEKQPALLPFLPLVEGETDVAAGTLLARAPGLDPADAGAVEARAAEMFVEHYTAQGARIKAFRDAAMDDAVDSAHGETKKDVIARFEALAANAVWTKGWRRSRGMATPESDAACDAEVAAVQAWKKAHDEGKLPAFAAPGALPLDVTVEAAPPPTRAAMLKANPQEMEARKLRAVAKVQAALVADGRIAAQDVENLGLEIA